MADEHLLGYIQAFALRYFTPEMQHEIDTSLGICDAFEYDAIYENIQNAIFDNSTATTDLESDLFLAEFDRAMDALLISHSIKLMDGTPLHQKNQLLTALYRFQHYEDRTPLLRILESDLTSEEKLAQVISVLSTADISTIMEVIESFDDTLIPTMAKFLEDKESKLDAYDEQVKKQNEALLANLKLFFNFFGTDNLAQRLLETELEVGYTFDVYYGHFKDYAVTPDVRMFAMNLLSMFLISSDCYTDPVGAYRRLSETLVENSADRVKLENNLKDLYQSFTNYKEALDVAKRVSTV